MGSAKTVKLANLRPDTIDQARAATESGLNRVGSNYGLCFSRTGLSFDHDSPRNTET